jgi:hypothetical protein
MEDEHGMIPMGVPDEIDETDALDAPDAPDAPTGLPALAPTVKARNAAQQEVSRLLDTLAPERAAHRMGAKANEVERFRTPRGCVLQAKDGAVTVSWFPDSAQGAELGELQVVMWRGTVSHPGSSKRTAGAQAEEEMVLRPVDRGAGDIQWRATDGSSYSTEALAAHCTTALERWIGQADGG